MIPTEIRDRTQFVLADDGNKMPLSLYGYASVGKPETWTTYEIAAKAVEDGLHDYLGYVFTEDDGIVGIDIDTGFDETGFIPTQESLEIIEKCQSYTELSKSGRGFHILLKGKLPFKGRNNQKGIEIYSSGRYFILTGNSMAYERVIENQSAIDYVVDKFFHESREKGERKSNFTVYKPVWHKPNKKIKLNPDYPPITAGSRNISLTSLGGQMWIVGYSKDIIYQELLKVNENCCQPKLSRNEIQNIVMSVCKYKR